MVVEFPGSLFPKLLKESAKEISPSLEQCERILKAVQNTVRQESVDFATAAATVKKLEYQNRQKHRRIASGAGTAVLAAGLFLVLTISPGLPGSRTVILDEGEIPLAPGFDVQLPGGYLLEALPDGGFVPVVEGYRVENGKISLYLGGDRTEILWSACYATDADGQKVMPVLVDPEKGMLVFLFPDGGMEINLVDIAGNQAIVTVYPV